MGIKTFFVYGCAVLLASAAAWGQVRVVKTASDKVSVDLSGLSAGGTTAAQTALRVFRMDVERSGWLGVVDAGRGDVVVAGSVVEQGGQVVFTVDAKSRSGAESYVRGTFAMPPNQAIDLAHHVADALIVKVSGKKSFAKAKLIMIGTRTNHKELYTADSTAEDIRQLTNDRSIAVKPRWSPDNQLVSYTSYLNRYPDVYTVNMATGARKREAAFPGLNSGGAISPDGRSMALILSKDGNPDLYVKDLVSGRLSRLTNTPRDVEGSPVWSPDGSRIVYVSNVSGTYQLYIISKTGGAPERLTSTGSQNVAPDWGANGLIAYQTMTGGKFQIAFIDPQTKEGRVITPYDASYEDPSWAPDGRHLAAARSVNYKSSIYLLDTMGDNPLPLTSSGDWYAPAWTH